MMQSPQTRFADYRAIRFVDAQVPIGSSPLFAIVGAASEDVRNRSAARAAFASLVLRATPAENNETFCTSGGSGVMFHVEHVSLDWI